LEKVNDLSATLGTFGAGQVVLKTNNQKKGGGGMPVKATRQAI